jgi:hypothetical protein
MAIGNRLGKRVELHGTPPEEDGEHAAYRSPAIFRLSVSYRGPSKILLSTILGGMAGLLIAVGLASLLEYLDQGLRKEADVIERLGVPCLGVIPHYTATRPGVPAPKRGRGKHAERHFQAAGEAFPAAAYQPGF